MQMGKDYVFRDEYKEDTVPIELLTGPYKGVILRFTKVSIQEQKNNTASCTFDYEIYETGDRSEVSLRKDEQFTEHVGLILNSLILESIDAADNKN